MQSDDAEVDKQRKLSLARRSRLLMTGQRYRPVERNNISHEDEPLRYASDGLHVPLRCKQGFASCPNPLHVDDADSKREDLTDLPACTRELRVTECLSDV